MDDLVAHRQDKSLQSFVNRMETRISRLRVINTELDRQIDENNKELKELESEHELLCNIINQMREAKNE